MQPELIVPVKGSEWGGHRLQTYLDCPKKYYWNYVHNGTGLEPIGGKQGTRFGTIIHHGLQVYYESIKHNPTVTYVTHCIAALQSAQQLIEDDAEMSLEDKLVMKEHVARCLSEYFIQYEHGDIKPVKIEHPFTLDISGYEHTGIMDLIGEYAGHLVVCDHKTTGKDWNTFFKQFRFDLSLLGYVYYARQHYGKEVHLLINGIRKTKHKVPQFEYNREIFMLSDEDMNEWKDTVRALRMEINAYDYATDPLWRKNPGQCVSNYGECTYRKLCTFPDPAMEKTFYKPRERR